MFTLYYSSKCFQYQKDNSPLPTNLFNSRSSEVNEVSLKHTTARFVRNHLKKVDDGVIEIF